MKNKYWELFKSTFLLSTFTFGGGYVIISLMQKKFVEELKWIDEKEMLSFVAIAQSTPGAVAVNVSILLGYKIGGVFGAFLSIIGTILPPLVIVSVISFFYEAFKSNLYISLFLKSMQAAVVAVIFDVVMNLSKSLFKEKNVVLTILMVLAFIATYFFKVNLLLIILICALVGVAQTFIKGRLD